MRRIVSGRWLSLLLIPWWAAFLAATSHGATPAKAASELIADLATTPHVLVMRHAYTDHSQKDLERQNLEDCSQQRNLSLRGIRETRQIRRVIDDRGIRFGKVISSPYCRCKDTANLMADNVSVHPDLRFSIDKNQAEAKRHAEFLLNLAQSVELEQGHALLVTHTSNIYDAFGVWPKPEGVMLVFSRTGGKLAYQGMITPQDWSSQP